MHNAKTHRVLTLTVNPAGRIVGVGITRPRTAVTAAKEAWGPAVRIPDDHANEALRGCTVRKAMVTAERFPRNYDCLDLLGRDAVDVAVWLVTP